MVALFSQSRTGNREKASAVSRFIRAIGLRWQRARQVARQVRDHYLEAVSPLSVCLSVCSMPNCRFRGKVINWGLYRLLFYLSCLFCLSCLYLCNAKLSAVACLCVRNMYVHVCIIIRRAVNQMLTYITLSINV